MGGGAESTGVIKLIKLICVLQLSELKAAGDGRTRDLNFMPSITWARVLKMQKPKNAYLENDMNQAENFLKDLDCSIFSPTDSGVCFLSTQ